MIYIATFLISFLCMYLGRKSKYKIPRYIGSLAAIILPSALAGLRDFSIGTDINEYGNAWFRFSIQYHYDLLFFLKFAVGSDIGALYALLNYIISSITDNVHWFYFALSLLTNVIVVKALDDNEDIIDPSFGYLSYLFLFYNLSLNAMRQSVAIALILYGYKYIKEKKNIRYLIVVLVATMFHSSAVAAVTLLVIGLLSNGKQKLVTKSLMLALCFGFVLFFPQIIKIFVNTGIISTRYFAYAINTKRGGGFERIILLCMPFIIMTSYGIRGYSGLKKEVFNELSMFLGFSTILSLMAFRLTYAVRVAYYFDIMLAILSPFLMENSKLQFKVQKKHFNSILIISYLLIYWIVVYAIRNSGETVPYMFMLD